MDFYNTIQHLSDEQIKELISFKIDEAIYLSQALPTKFIGINCDINPKRTFDGEEKFEGQAMWQGFIPPDVKVIYSFVPNEEGYTVNNGCYYYIDDHEYIYEFAKYIKNIKVNDEIDFLSYVYNFIEHYFYSLLIEDSDRLNMHRPLLNNEGKYITPTIKHRFNDFKGTNTAMCSEFCAMAQNILSIFGYKMIYFGGAVNSTHGRGGHAFNLTTIQNQACFLDFTIPVNVYSIDGTLIQKAPFIGVISNFSQETLRRYIIERIPSTFDDYYFLDTGVASHMISNGEKRTYVIGNVATFDKNNKTYKKN